MKHKFPLMMMHSNSNINIPLQNGDYMYGEIISIYTDQDLRFIVILFTKYHQYKTYEYGKGVWKN